MKISLTKKFWALLITILFLLVIFANNVKASEYLNTVQDISEKIGYQETKQDSFEEEKILQYDAKTGKTTEINMEDISKKLVAEGKNIEENSIPPYIPNNNFLKNYYNTYEPLMPLSSIEPFNNVIDMSEFPYRVTCRLECSGGSGSGFLVGPNLLLTSAHCVMNPKDNSKYTDWIAYPGFRGTAYKGYSDGWAQIIYSSAWISDHKPEDDWCICVLGSNLRRLSWLDGTKSIYI
mgnify:FL=1